jgi:hypothetical protein
MRFFNRQHAVYATAIAIAAAAQPVFATLTATVVPVVIPDGHGNYDFTYEVTNAPTSTVNFGAFYLEVDPAANLSSLSAPTGYLDLYTPGDSTIEFASTDPSADITSGATGQFSFVSAVGPGADPYAVQSYDDGSFYNGTTLGPTAVPEPASSGLIPAGSIALLRRRRA